MVTKENEAARYNKGKVRYSFIDFNMFKDMNKNFDSIKHIKTEEDCIFMMFSIISTIVFTNNKAIHKAYIPILQVLGYRLSLFQLDFDFYYSPVYDLRAFESMARVLEYGANKYDRNNWRKGYADKFSTVDSLYRHIKEIVIGNKIDEESKLPHIGHIMCNIMFLTNDLLYIDR